MILISNKCPACKKIKSDLRKKKIKGIKLLDIEKSREARKIAQILGVTYVPFPVMIKKVGNRTFYCELDVNFNPLRCVSL